MTATNPAAQAAAEIVALINASPHSPRADEIEEVIKRCGTARMEPPPLGEALAGWAAVVGKFVDRIEHGVSDDESDALEGPFVAATQAVWAKPVRSWEDVALRAAVAVHWNSPLAKDDPPYPEWVLRDVAKGGEDRCLDEVALAHVVKAVCDLAGLRFDLNGRVLSD